MAINLIEGRPGCGKSYEAARYHIIETVKKGRKVITNLPINKDAIRKHYGEEAANLIEIVAFDFHDYSTSDGLPFSSPEDYKDEWRGKGGIGPLYVIDEAQFILGNASSGKNRPSDDLVKMYCMHRHLGLDITLITQSNGNLHKSIRALIHIRYRCVKLDGFGRPDEYASIRHSGTDRTEIARETRKYDSFFFQFYNSHTASQSPVTEAETLNVNRWYKSKGGIALLVFVILVVIGFVNLFFNTDNPFTSRNPEKVSEKVTQSIETYSETAQEQAQPYQTPTRVVSARLPLEGFKMTITGFYKGLRLDSKTKKGIVEEVYYLELEKDSIKTEAKSTDLEPLGYAFVKISDCLFDIQHEGNQVGYALCDYKKPFRPEDGSESIQNEEDKGLIDKALFG